MEREWSDSSEESPFPLYIAHKVLVSIPNLQLYADRLPASLVNCQRHQYRFLAVKNPVTDARYHSPRPALAVHIFEWLQDRNDGLTNWMYHPVTHPRLLPSNLYIRIRVFSYLYPIVNSILLLPNGVRYLLVGGTR